MLRGRFAPTPSGLLHLGNARTALLAWLQTRSAGGRFLLRIEDIDKPRSRPELALRQLDDLRWLGLDWDEGPDVGGPFAPYWQSERESLYADAVSRLQGLDALYPCYCSRTELLAVASAPHGLAAEGPHYSGTCKHLTAEQRARKEAAGKTPSLRFAIPEQPVSFRDGIAGEVHFPAGAGGDFIIRRADSILAYQLAVVVDDAAMGVTDVLRGADLLDSTPRQLLLYDTLGLQPPRFAHVPLLHGPDGERLSKRHGSLSLAAIRQQGVAPEEVVGVLAATSGLIDRVEPIRASELIPLFSLERIPRQSTTLSPAMLAGLFAG